MDTVSTILGYLTTDVTVVLIDNLSLVIQIIISHELTEYACYQYIYRNQCI